MYIVQNHTKYFDFKVLAQSQGQDLAITYVDEHDFCKQLNRARAELIKENEPEEKPYDFPSAYNQATRQNDSVGLVNYTSCHLSISSL